MNARLIAAGALLAGIGAMYACGESTSPLAPRSSARTVSAATSTNAAPNVASADRSSADGANSGHRVKVLRWTEKLDHDVVASATIGPRGGTIRLPHLGTTFSVPAGALTARTTITVRADSGRRVVFEMQPSGLHFAVPATLTIDLKFTNAYHKNAWAKLLEGGYITSATLIGTDDGVDTYQDMPATVDPAVTTASFPVPHFSVVILASQLSNCCAVVGN